MNVGWPSAPRRFWRRPLAALAVASALTLAGGLVLVAQGQSPESNEPVEVVRKTPPDIGVDAIEVPEGGTFRGPVTLEMKHGAVTLPQAYGIIWATGEVWCGDTGNVVHLPAGTKICFSDDDAIVEVMDIAKADRGLLKKILESARDRKVRPSSITGELP